MSFIISIHISHAILVFAASWCLEVLLLKEVIKTIDRQLQITGNLRFVAGNSENREERQLEAW